MNLVEKIAEPTYDQDIAYDSRFRDGYVIENCKEFDRCLWCNKPVMGCSVVKTYWAFKYQTGDVRQKIWHQDCLTDAINKKPRPAPESQSLARFSYCM